MRWFVGWKALFWGLLMVHFAESHGPERRQAYLVADLDSGKILQEKKCNERVLPSLFNENDDLISGFWSLSKASDPVDNDFYSLEIGVSTNAFAARSCSWRKINGQNPC